LDYSDFHSDAAVRLLFLLLADLGYADPNDLQRHSNDFLWIDLQSQTRNSLCRWTCCSLDFSSFIAHERQARAKKIIES
jgi:hypothetical protein